MFGTRWRLFRLLGIPIYVDPSWLIILALLTMTVAGLLPQLAAQYYPGVNLGIPVWGYWIAGLFAALAFFVCIVLHELGHAVAARTQNLPTRGITLFLFGGVAELTEEPRSPSAEFIMAIAGPAVSLVLAIGLGILSGIGFYNSWPPILVISLGYLAAINMMVLIFNLIPAFPLDGGRVLRSILWSTTGSLRRATKWAATAGGIFAWVLIGWGVLNLFRGHEFIISGLWLIFIGWFLRQAAISSYSQVLVRQILAGESVRRFMNPDPISVPPNMSIRELVDDYVYHYHRKSFPVVENGHPVGYIDTRDLGGVPRGEWEFRTVDEVMRRDLRPYSIRPDADALDALKKMQRTGASRLLVVDGDHLVGILSLKDLLRFLSLKLELEGEGQEPSASDVAADQLDREDEAIEAGPQR